MVPSSCYENTTKTVFNGITTVNCHQNQHLLSDKFTPMHQFFLLQTPRVLLNDSVKFTHLVRPWMPNSHRNEEIS